MLILSHISAFEYWRSLLSANRAHRNTTRAEQTQGQRKPFPSTQAFDSLSNSLPSQLDVISEPFHILCPGKAPKRTPPGVRFHEWNELRTAHILHVEEAIFVSSPELCFLQLASILDLENLIQAGCELCSSFRYPIQPDDKLPKRQPATNPKKLQKFLDSCTGRRGAKKARRALRYIHAECASPAEIVLAQILHHPYSLGGYGFPRPAINRKINLTETAKRTTRRKFFVADLYWPEAKLDVEYDGNAYHASHKDRSKDANRRNTLGLMGIEVMTVTRDQLFNLEEMDDVALTVSKHLKKRIRPKSNFRQKQQELRKRLLGYLRTRKFQQPGLYEANQA